MSARSAFCRQAWSRMVALYGVPGIGPLCLALQEAFEADVPVLLFFALADAAGEGLEPADFDRLTAAAAEWRALAVVPLRRIRVDLKDRAVTPELQTFRAAIKASELEAERLEVARLAETFEPLSGPPGLAPAYLARLGVPPDETARALAALRDAAQSVTRPSRAS
ncbi:TIGR02444 family protein [uncultured Alsobacter sp.]|uniref:TIGR02444 family protein n=1 Tax=uncultured Alsobacter sp. TaxID=1748258 RepID=UPI0025CE5A37|nr:TIGR02444 family protein [uncultured Alsobacter sp.]